MKNVVGKTEQGAFMVGWTAHEGTDRMIRRHSSRLWASVIDALKCAQLADHMRAQSVRSSGLGARTMIAGILEPR